MPERMYEIYCGNYDCTTRLAGVTHKVFDSEMEDGVVWVCPVCRARERVAELDQAIKKAAT
jgi:hypothetical protein